MPNSADRTVWQTLDASLFQETRLLPRQEPGQDFSANATFVSLPVQGDTLPLPLQGWAGWVDWRTHGLLSQFIQSQAITPRDSWILLPYAPPNRTQRPIQVLARLCPAAAVSKANGTPQVNPEEFGRRLQALGSHLRWAFPRTELTSHAGEQAIEALLASLQTPSSETPRIFFGELS